MEKCGSTGSPQTATVFLLHVAVQSGLQIDVEVEEPETSENPTQSFEIHPEAHTAFGCDNIYYIDIYIIYYII